MSEKRLLCSSSIALLAFCPKSLPHNMICSRAALNFIPSASSDNPASPMAFERKSSSRNVRLPRITAANALAPSSDT